MLNALPAPDATLASKCGRVRALAWFIGRETILVAIRAADGSRVRPGDRDHAAAVALIERAAIELRASGRAVTARQLRRARDGETPRPRPADVESLDVALEAVATVGERMKRGAILGHFGGDGRLARHAGVYARLAACAAEGGAV